jgi:hypothetical protein
MKELPCPAQPKASASRSSQGLEMALIEGEHIEDSVALGKNDDRGVLGVGAHSGGQQVVECGQDERRQE